jgi:hypothetical protein
MRELGFDKYFKFDEETLVLARAGELNKWLKMVISPFLLI